MSTYQPKTYVTTYTGEFLSDGLGTSLGLGRRGQIHFDATLSGAFEYTLEEARANQLTPEYYFGKDEHFETYDTLDDALTCVKERFDHYDENYFVWWQIPQIGEAGIVAVTRIFMWFE